MKSDNPQLWVKDETPKTFCNTTIQKIQVEYLDEKNQPQTYILEPQTTYEYPTYLADFLINKIYDVLTSGFTSVVSPEQREIILKDVLSCKV